VIDGIGKRSAPRLYIREWMDELGVNNKKLAERMERAESTISKLLAAADQKPHTRSRQKVTVEYLAEFAFALNLEVPQLFRDPKAPTRDELLRGYSNEQLTSAIQLIEHTRAIASTALSEIAHTQPGNQQPQRAKRAASSK
jgi:transcriptional regulator with XRE-family HTH domain